MTRFVSDWVVRVNAPPERGGFIDVADGSDAQERVRGIILPGLVNAHVHFDLSALRGRAPGGHGILAWMEQLLREIAGLGPEGLAAAVPAAVDEAVALGTAAVAEITSTLASVSALFGRVRGVVYQEIRDEREVGTPGDAIADAVSTQAQAAWPRELGYAVTPHAPYSTSGRMIERMLRVAPSNVPLTIHAGEDAEEVAMLRSGGGTWPLVLRKLGLWDRSTWVPRKSVVEHLDALGFLARRPAPLLVHMVHASTSDIELAVARGATFVLCPRSNLHIGGRLADVPTMIACGAALALGTDGLCSNDSLSLWSEMAALARAFPDVAPEHWVRAATLGGASALGLDSDDLGWILVEIDAPPGSDPYAALATAEPGRVRWLKRPDGCK